MRTIEQALLDTLTELHNYYYLIPYHEHSERVLVGYARTIAVLVEAVAEEREGLDRRWWFHIHPPTYG